MPIVTLPAQTWVQLPDYRAMIVLHSDSASPIIYSISDTQPDGFDTDTVIAGATTKRQGIQAFSGIRQSEFVWAYSPNEGSYISVTQVNDTSFPDGTFYGQRAITQQGYIEANVKNGLQFYVRKSYPLGGEIPSGSPVELLFRTTSKKVLAKSRIVSYIGEEFQVEVFEAPTVTSPGAQIATSNYSRVNPIAGTAEFYDSPTVTDDGTPFDAEPQYYFGGSSSGNRSASTIPEGRERVLPENTDFLIRITNNGNNAGRFSYFLDWYEGEPDLPLA